MSGRGERRRVQLIALGFFILAAGVASSVQALVNSEVGRRTDPVTAATVSFMGGLAVLLIIGAVSGRLQLAAAAQLAYLGHDAGAIHRVDALVPKVGIGQPQIGRAHV